MKIPNPPKIIGLKSTPILSSTGQKKHNLSPQRQMQHQNQYHRTTNTKTNRDSNQYHQ